MSDAPPQYAGVPLRDHDVRLSVSAAEAVAAGRSQRGRLLEALKTLGPDEWAQPSRCAAWTVQDVVRHLTHVQTMSLDSIVAARAGERYTGFSAGSFNPKVTPDAFLKEAGDQDTAATLAGYEESLRALTSAVDELASTPPEEVLVSTPVGRQPWDRSLLHGLFDSAVHERDILVPLGRTVEAPAAEVTAIASYQVLLVARILAVVGASVDLDLDLRGGPHLRVLVDGPVVAVAPADGAATPAAVSASGDVDAVLDAMTGRGAMADVLEGPPEVVMGLSALASLV